MKKQCSSLPRVMSYMSAERLRALTVVTCVPTVLFSIICKHGDGGIENFRLFVELCAWLNSRYSPTVYLSRDLPSIPPYHLPAFLYYSYFFLLPAPLPHASLSLFLPQPGIPSQRIWAWRSQRVSGRCGPMPWPLTEEIHCPWHAQWGCKSPQRWGPDRWQWR